MPTFNSSIQGIANPLFKGSGLQIRWNWDRNHNVDL